MVQPPRVACPDGCQQDPQSPPDHKDTVFDFIRLSPTLRDGQDRFVASNAVSLAQAYVSPYAWPRGVFAGDDAVGFLMLEDIRLNRSTSSGD